MFNTTHIKEITGEAGAGSFKNQYEPRWGGGIHVTSMLVPVIKDKCVVGLDKARSCSALGQHHGQLLARRNTDPERLHGSNKLDLLQQRRSDG